jgi:outer membrane protein assembly factor BamB
MRQNWALEEYCRAPHSKTLGSMSLIYTLRTDFIPKQSNARAPVILYPRPFMKQPRFLFLATLAAWLTTSASAENWAQWRGPFFNGSTTESNLPNQWSKTENISWLAPMPGYSGATPIIWEDTVFVSSPNAEKELLLLCLDRSTGKVRWQKVVATGNREKGRNNMASPSPVTDGKTVFILYGTGDLAAFDFSGRQLWSRNLGHDFGRFSINWLYGSSPLLYGGKLFVPVLQRNPVPTDYAQAQDGNPQRESYLLCLDPANGQTLWRQIRPTDAFSEAQEAYTTPIPFEGKAGPEVILVGGNYVTAHSADSGAELWRCGGLNDRRQPFWRIVPSPVAADGMIFACGPKRDPVLAIKDGGKGLVTDTHIAWKFKEHPSDCVTPLFYRQRLFVLDGDHQVLTCLEPQTGKILWQGDLGVREIFRASPTGADGKIYCLGENGTAVVLEAGPEFKILATIKMGEEPVRASIAAAQGHLFLRTAQNLYCIGQP